MTARKVYEDMLVELNTIKAPSLHLEDFLYFYNKGVQEYVNLRYARYEDSQQLSDDLQWLSSTVMATVDSQSNTVSYTGSYSGTKGAVSGRKYNSAYIQTVLPDNYLHLLNVITDVKTSFPYKCDPAGYVHGSGTKKLTSDVGANIMNNVFLRPDYRDTYHSIVDDYITNEKQGSIQLHYGDHNKFSLPNFSIDYLKKPQVVTLTVAERDAIIDNSQELEYPFYVANEINKVVLKLVLENQSNPRQQSAPAVNQSIRP